MLEIFGVTLLRVGSVDKLGVLLMAFSVVCFVLSIFNSVSPTWNRLVSAGLAFLALAFFFGNLGSVFK